MYQLFRTSLATFRLIRRKVLLLGAMSLLIAGLLLVPVINWLFNRILRFSGNPYLLNSDLIRLLSDWRSLSFIAFLTLLIIIAFFLEFAIILVITREGWQGRQAKLTDAMATAFRALPRILGFGLLQYVLIILLALPLIGHPLSRQLLGNFDLPDFLRSQIQGSRFWTVLYLLAAVIFLYWLIRTIFSLHFIVLTGQTLRRAIRSSLRLTRHRLFHLVFLLLLFNLLTVGLAIFLFSQMSQLPGLIRLRYAVAVVENFLMLLGSYLTFVTALALIPVNMIFLTGLFYRFLPSADVPDDSRYQVVRSRLFGPIELQLSRPLAHNRLLRSALLTLCLVLTFYLNFSLYQQSAYLRWNVKVISHRGDMAAAPENSLRGIDSAVSKGVDLIEVDVMLSADEIPVLHHDQTLRRLAGRPDRVRDLTAVELNEIAIGVYEQTDVEYAAIPTLEQAIVRMQDDPDAVSQLLLDLKPDDRMSEMAAAVVNLIERYEIVHTCYVQSFNPVILELVRQLNPDIRLGQVLSWAAGDLSALDVDYYAISSLMVSEDFIRRAQRQGRQVWVWTINDEDRLRSMLSFEIDGIITDYPERLQALIVPPPVTDLLLADSENDGGINADEAE